MCFGLINSASVSQRNQSGSKLSGFLHKEQHRVNLELHHVCGGAAGVAAFSLYGDLAHVDAASGGDGDGAVVEEVQNVVDGFQSPAFFAGILQDDQKPFGGKLASAFQNIADNQCLMVGQERQQSRLF